MANAQLGSLVGYLRTLADESVITSDSQLLEKYVEDRNEAAFTSLLRRHGPMVWGVCRRLLGDEHEAEDAFQATFLVLASRAGFVRKGQSVGAWLHRIGCRIATKARVRAARRQEHQQANTRHGPDPALEAACRELRALLDEAVDRLPNKYRAPILLCYFEGQTVDQAARQLACPRGTVASRLTQGRKLLRDRLARRGFALSAGSLTTVLLAASSADGLSPALVRVTARAALRCAAGKAAALATSSAKVAILVEEAAKGLVLGSFRMGLMSTVTLVLVITLGALLRPSSRSEVPDALPPQTQPRDAPEQHRTDQEQARIDFHGDPLPPGAIARLGTVRLRHGGTITCLAYAPDGKTLVSCGEENSVRLWDAETGKELRQFAGHVGGALCASFAPDGKTLATGGWDYTVRLWEVATGKQLQLCSAMRQIYCVAFSQDGRVIAAGGHDRLIHLFDVATSQELRQIQGHEDTIYDLAFLPDGKTVISGSADATIRLWVASTGIELHRYPVPRRGVCCLAVTPDGKVVASACAEDGEVQLREIATGKELRRLSGHRIGINALAFSRDGKVVASGGRDASVRLWEAETGRLLRQIDHHRQQEVGAIAFSPTDKTLASAESRAIRLWDVASGKERQQFSGHHHWVYSVAFSPDGNTLLSGSLDQTLRLWEVATGKEQSQLTGHKDMVSSAAFSPDGKMLASVASDGTIRLWDRRTQQQYWQIPMTIKTAGTVAFAPAGSILALACEPEVTLWDINRRIKLGQFHGGGWTLAFSPDGKLLTSGVALWEVPTGKEVYRFPLHDQPGHADFSPDGNLLAFGDWDGKNALVRLWNVATRNEVQRGIVRPHGSEAPIGTTIVCVAFSRDGKTLASAHRDGTVRLWEVSSGKERHCFQGHRGAVFHLAFSPDGQALASGSGDQTVLIWDLWGRAEVQEVAAEESASRTLGQLWVRLASADAAESYQATRTLVRSPVRSVRFLKQQLQPVLAIDPERTTQLVKELDSPLFAARENAVRELLRFGESAELALRKALAGQGTPETRRRAQQVLEKLAPERSRTARAIEVLEHIATAEAEEVLRALVKGSPEASVTQEAKAALRRMTKPRPAQPP